jgi:hypothetical protein
MLTKKYILECLDKYCTFGGITSDTFYEMVVVPLKSNQCFNNWTWDNGASKGVLIFKELDYVIKIPFEGQGEYNESHYEDEDGNWIWEEDSRWNSNLMKVHSEELFDEFCGAIYGNEEDSRWNYCAVEAFLSNFAKIAGLEQCFAITECIGQANGHPIYAQEKCCIFSEASSTTNREKYRNRSKTDYDSLKEVRERVDFWGIDDDWVLDFLIYWGEEIFKKFVAFIFEYDISDLHNGNIGYRKGVPCLVDYSGYDG